MKEDSNDKESKQKHEVRLSHLDRQIKLHRDIVEKLIHKNGLLQMQERLKKRELKQDIKAGSSQLVQDTKEAAGECFNLKLPQSSLCSILEKVPSII